MRPRNWWMQQLLRLRDWWMLQRKLRKQRQRPRPDSVPIESEEERDAREADEMAAIDAVGDYEADPNVMLEDVPQDIVMKTLKVSCACVPVLVFARVCVRACTRRRYVFVRICICIF
jgi:hypothetical protein